MKKGARDSFSRELLKWAKANERSFPWRDTTDPYGVCVAEIMLQQTFARKVVPVYEAFMKKYPDAKALSKARIPSVEKLIRPLGFLYRGRKLVEMGKFVVRQRGNVFPQDKDDILKLPGVGPYTTASVECFAYGRQVPIIDANVVRVYTRYFGLGGKLPNSAPTREMSEIASSMLPRGKARAFNYALLDFASLVCTHYNPKHEECPVKSGCREVA